MCHTEAVAARASEDARDFLVYCRNLAASRPDEENFLTRLFAPALLNWVRHPPLPEGVVIQVTTPCRVSTDAATFRAIHEALHNLLVRYVEQQIKLYLSSQQPGVFDVQNWMSVVEKATRALEPRFAKQVSGLWRALAIPVRQYFAPGFGLDRLSRFILPPSPFRLALVVDMNVSDDIPALFAVVLPNGILQPIGDWLQDHWQETEQIHALSEQWNAMVEACFSAYRAEINFCNPFVVSEALAKHLRSEVCSEQLAWFNCTLRGNIPKHVTAQEIKVRSKGGEAPRTGELNVQALLDFSYEVVIDGKRLTDRELIRLFDAEQDQEVVLGSNILSPDLMCALRNQLQALKRLGTNLSGRELSLFDALQSLSKSSTRESASLAQSRRFLADRHRQLEMLLWGAAQPMPQLPEATDKVLMKHQREGVRFLWEGTARGLGVCLADDMGLGKTLQVIALLQLWNQAGLLSSLPALIIMPPMLLENWRAELERWAPEPSLRVKICHPSCLTRDEKDGLRTEPETVLRGYKVVLIGYSMILNLPVLQQLTFPAIILDEAHKIKNAGSRTSEAVRALHGVRCIALTGTPVMNSLQDLWTLSGFLNPGLLGDEVPQQMKSNPEAVMPALRQLVKPFLLRREKTILNLPSKTEKKVYCKLTATQVLAYRAIVDSLREDLQNATGRFSRSGLVLRKLSRLKQLCNHPDQLTPSADYTPENSGKFCKLLELAKQIVDSGEKFLLFSQYQKINDPLHALLSKQLKCPGFVVHGSIPVEERSVRVVEFQKQNGPAFFIISLHAGGVGLNLTAATHVIHFDRWWNPAVENQATDRAYRIGQTRPVTVHKFICSGTIEERIDALIERRRALTEGLLSEGPEKLLTDMSNDELLNLFRYDTSVAEER